MKKKDSTIKAFIMALAMLILTGCNDDIRNEIRDKRIVKKTRLNEMMHQGRHYEFYYDKKKFVDYINTDAGYLYQAY